MHRAVKLGYLIRVARRRHLVSVRALSVMSGSFMLAGSHMGRGLIMVFRRAFAAVRGLRVMFLNLACHADCLSLFLTARVDTSARMRR